MDLVVAFETSVEETERITKSSFAPNYNMKFLLEMYIKYTDEKRNQYEIHRLKGLGRALEEF